MGGVMLTLLVGFILYKKIEQEKIKNENNENTGSPTFLPFPFPPSPAPIDDIVTILPFPIVDKKPEKIIIQPDTPDWTKIPDESYLPVQPIDPRDLIIPKNPRFRR